MKRIAEHIGAKSWSLVESLAPPLRFSYSDEVTVLVRPWPTVPAMHQNSFVKAVDQEMDDLLLFRTEDLIRYRVLIPLGQTRDDVKVDIIRRMNELSYQWVPFLKNMDKVKKRVFGFLD